MKPGGDGGEGGWIDKRLFPYLHLEKARFGIGAQINGYIFHLGIYIDIVAGSHTHWYGFRVSEKNRGPYQRGRVSVHTTHIAALSIDSE